MRDPALRHPGCGGVYAVSDEWLWRRGRERGVRSEGTVASPRVMSTRRREPSE